MFIGFGSAWTSHSVVAEPVRVCLAAQPHRPLLAMGQKSGVSQVISHLLFGLDA
jgi:hypothetical protein